jgi:N utilization substance protein A
VVRDEEGRPVLDENGEPLTEEGKEVVLDVIVGSEQLSLAIGKRGQNVRLASKLLDCRIEIKSQEAVKDELASALATMLREMEGISEEEEIPELEAVGTPVSYDEMIPLEDMEMRTDRVRERLEGHGIHTVQDVLARDASELSNIPGIGPVTANKLLDMANQTLEESLSDAAESVVGEE